MIADSRRDQHQSAAVVTPHYLATETASEIMAEGGNAVDAAIAANAVLGVVAPETCGVGGDLFALIHVPGEDRPRALNSSGRAGSGADPEPLRAAGHRLMPLMGRETVTVPGCVDGWEALRTSFGSMSRAALLAPALRYASRGFPASVELCQALTARWPELAPQPVAADLVSSGVVPAPGDQVVRTQLASTLRELAAGGRSAFYEGEAGAAITAATSGIIVAADLQRPQAEWVEPLGLDVFGLTGWTVPPNSQGYLTLTSLAVYEAVTNGLDLDAGASLGWHLAIESYRSQVADRAEVLSDPESAPVPAATLVAPSRWAPAVSVIDPGARTAFPAPTPAPGGTAFLCVLDQAGLGISLIQSNFMGLGTSLGAGRAGFLLHNRGAGFDLRAGHPNELAPGRRPLHTLSPTLWTRQGLLACLLGTRGGDYQPQLLMQMAIHLFTAGVGPATAQARPRWVIEAIDEPDGVVGVEGSTPPEVVAGLGQRGHRVEVHPGLQGGWGPVSVITVDPTGLVDAAADTRVGTAAGVVL